jgi:hypothetical protein
LSLARSIARPIARPVARPITGESSGGGSAPEALLLDTYTGAAAAYSLRKLRTAYAGAAIRVRRSSDNAEQDIGFVANELDTASLLTFCGAGNGFVVTWYDQSGNSRNATQATTTSQPRIVNSGVVDAGVVFDGVNDTLSAASWATISQPFSRNYVVAANTASGQHLLNAVLNNIADFVPSVGQLGMFAGTVANGIVFNSSRMVVTSVYNGSASRQFKNGIGTSAINPGSNPFGGLRIASFGGTGSFAIATFQEILLTETAISDTDREFIEANQIAEYLS